MFSFNDKEIFRVLANYYFNLGLNVTCISNTSNNYNSKEKNLLKSPSHPWDHLISKRQTVEELQSYDWQDAVGIGYTTGNYYKNNYKIASVDIDGKGNDYLHLGFVRSLLEVLELPSDYEWVIKSGSNDGYHILFLWNEDDIFQDRIYFPYKVVTMLPNFKYYDYFKRIDLCFQFHMVLPPSVHESYNTYQFVNRRLPLDIPNRISIRNVKKLTDKFCSKTFYQVPISSGSLFEELWHEKIIFDALSHSNRIGYEEVKKPLYLIIDVETNGLPLDFKRSFTDHSNWPRIVEFSWMLFDSTANILFKKNIFVDAEDFDINSEILKLTNRDKRINDSETYDLRDALDDLEKWASASDYIVGHNVEYDIMCLLAEYNRIQKDSSLNKKLHICTMKESTNFCKIESKNGFKYPKLAELYEALFKSTPTTLHNADADTYSTSKCFWELKKLGIIEV